MQAACASYICKNSEKNWGRKWESRTPVVNAYTKAHKWRWSLTALKSFTVSLKFTTARFNNNHPIPIRLAEFQPIEISARWVKIVFCVRRI